jgi:hypothetical protein
MTLKFIHVFLWIDSLVLKSKESIMTNTKHSETGGRRREEEWNYIGRGELVQGTLYTSMKLSH